MKTPAFFLATAAILSVFLASGLLACAGEPGSGSLLSQGASWGDREILAFIKEAPVGEDVKCYRSGLSLMRTGKYDKARDAFNRALVLNREWKMARYNRAVCLEKLGDVKGAGRDYLKSLGYDPFRKESFRNVTDVPSHFSVISCLFEVHRSYCGVTHYGRSEGPNRSFTYFYDYSPNLKRADQASGFRSGDDVAKMDKLYSNESDQQGYGMWNFFLYPSRPAAAGKANSYSLSYRVTDLPHLHGNTMVSIGSDPIKILADKWIMVFAFPEETTIRTMFDLRPYKYERKGKWMLFYYDYIGVRAPTAIHIGFSLNGDAPEGIDARTLNY
ncbi:MAG: tetratricopeptide repeat protein [Candidatus Xenobiia bacterium LiM19]